MPHQVTTILTAVTGLLIIVGFTFYRWYTNSEYEEQHQYTNSTPYCSTTSSSRAAPRKRCMGPGDTCIICQATMIQVDDIELTECGHAFHSGCIKQWRNIGPENSRGKCPLCRNG